MPARTAIDTNTFLSAAIRPGSTPSLAVERALRQSVVLVSDETWAELQNVLLRGKFDRYQAMAIRQRFLNELESFLERISVHTNVGVCRDSKDDKFLALAVDGHADAIITGDLDLLELHPFRGIDIITPGTFLTQ